MQPRSVEAVVAVAVADPEVAAAADRWEGPWRGGPLYTVADRGSSSDRHTVRGYYRPAYRGGYYRPLLRRLRIRAELLDRLLRGLSVLWLRLLRIPVPVLPAIPVLRLSLRLPGCWISVCGAYQLYPGASRIPRGVCIPRLWIRLRRGRGVLRRTNTGAPPNAEVFADGNNVGIADDFAGTSQHLELTPGAHSIEIHAPGMAAMVYDVNVQPGRTVTLRVR